MEAELFALQSVAQELASLGKLVGRVLRSLGRISVDELIAKPSYDRFREQPQTAQES